MSKWIRSSSELSLVALLIALGVAGRLYPYHPANFTPIAACALFAGYMLRSRALALCVPVIAYAISNHFEEAIDWRVTLAIGAGLSFPVLLSSFLRGREANAMLMMRVAGCAIVSSLVFFVISNLAVWLFSPLYTMDFNGLTRCFTNAIPFLRNTLAGDLIYSAVLFGSFAAISLGMRSVRGKLAFAHVPSQH